MSSPVPETSCPRCGRRFDRASDPTGEATPAPGSATVCIGCNALLVFTEDMGVRGMTEAEFCDRMQNAEFARNLAQAIITVQAMRQARLLQSHN